mgnify:CR=1 FL=1
MEENEKIVLFEKAAIPSAVAKLSVPMIFSSLVMVLYNMADTYFVGMLNNPVQNAAVSLAGSGAARLQCHQQPVWRGDVQYDEPGAGTKRV